MGDENDLKIPQNDALKGEEAGRQEVDPPDPNAPSNAEAEADAQGDASLLSNDAIDNVLRDMAGQEHGDEDPSFKTTPHGPAVNKADFQQLSVGNEKKTPQNIDLLMDVDLPVSIELGKTRMKIADILALGPGSVVELDKLVGEPVDLLVNQKCVARGEVVVVEESFGLRITQLMSPEERIKNLQ